MKISVYLRTVECANNLHDWVMSFRKIDLAKINHTWTNKWSKMMPLEIFFIISKIQMRYICSSHFFLYLRLILDILSLVNASFMCIQGVLTVSVSLVQPNQGRMLRKLMATKEEETGIGI